MDKSRVSSDLGRMGRPMASNLCRKGFRLTVNDINPTP